MPTSVLAAQENRTRYLRKTNAAAAAARARKVRMAQMENPSESFDEPATTTAGLGDGRGVLRPAAGAGWGAGTGSGAAGSGASILGMTLVPEGGASAPESIGSKSTATSPKRIVAPGESGSSPVTVSPSTVVPLVEPRSVTTHTPSRRCSFACDVLTLDSGTSAVTLRGMHVALQAHERLAGAGFVISARAGVGPDGRLAVEGSLTQALQFGAATLEAQEQANARFQQFQDRYLRRLDGPPLLWHD